MYAAFFGLKHEPFSIAPDPRYLYMSERHREALAHLLYGVGGGGGFVLLSGEVGTGKTTVCRCFLEQIPANCHVAYIFNPKLTVAELLRSICDEFHIPLAPGAASAKDFIDALNAFLLSSHAAGRSSVLIIDEAQALSADVLEQLRLLTNLETNERKLLQVVLIGQPELRQMLARPELEQVAQRVIARFHLEALSADETAGYIDHRLAVAGLASASPFTPRAVARLHALSRGVPRRVNLLCDRALLGAYAQGTAQVDRPTVERAAAEVFGPVLAPSGPAVASGALGVGWLGGPALRGALAGLLTGAVLLTSIFWMLGGRVANPVLPTRPIAAGAGGGALPAKGAVAMPVTPRSSSITAKTAAGTAVVGAVPSSAPLASTPPDALAQRSASALLGALAQSPDNSALAWQALGRAWGAKLSDSQACAKAWQQGLWCVSSTQMPLPLIRELDRPGVITLFDGERRSGQALLTAVTAQQATLHVGNATFDVPLSVLTQLWRGDFATLRRVPDGLDPVAAGSAATLPAQWLLRQLEKAGGLPLTRPPAAADTAPGAGAAATLQSHLSAFQLAHGLYPDGVAGPMTLMQLNRATGVDEPHLTGTQR